jgi:peptidoglycan/LPS O-acetylase OafA/YrhL
MASSERQTGHLPTLDGWRAIAALAVIACHSPGAWNYGLKDLGGYAVNVFFGLSGLLICSRLLAERDRTGTVDLPGFYVRRAFRILPPALMYLTTLAALAATGMLVASPRELWSCLGFFRNYISDEHWVTGHFWSLAVEEHFYLFCPVLIALLSPRRALVVALAVAVVLGVWHMADDRWIGIGPRLGLAPSHFRTDCRLPDLLFGCVVAMLASRTPVAIVRVVGGIGGALLAAKLFNIAVPQLLVSALIPWMLLATVKSSTGVAGRFLEWAPLRLVGRMSYSIYLWQQLFFYGPAKNRLPALGYLQDWPWNLLALAACATASHLLIEGPMTQMGRRFAAPRRRKEIVTEPVVFAYRLTPGRQPLHTAGRLRRKTPTLKQEPTR